MKKLCAFLAVVLSLTFAGITLAQDKPAADKPAATAEEHWTQLPPDPRRQEQSRFRVVRGPI